MDAHAFRIVGTCLLQLLEGARIEKVFGPFQDVTVWRFFTGSAKISLALRSDRQRPAFFCLQTPLPNPPIPSATVMRLRKYCTGARLGGGILDFSGRVLHFALMRQGETRCWLSFSLREGVLLSETAPVVQPPLWPEARAVASLVGNFSPAGIGEKAGEWLAYPLLTPHLRETLNYLELPDALALLVDLEAGGDSLFYYTKPDGSGGQYWAWPLPARLAKKKNLEEVEHFPPLPGAVPEAFAGYRPLLLASSVEEVLLLADYCQARNRKASLPFSKRSKRLAKTLHVLDEEEKRLQALIEGQKDACLIKDNLWQLDAEAKMASITLSESGDKTSDGHNPSRTIALDSSLNLMDNMTRMFHKADKGMRGLVHLATRRHSLEAEKLSLEEGRALPDTPIPPARGAVGKGSDLGANPPKGGMRHISRFTSQEGYTILRGKNAEGNQALLKQGQPYDYWLHAADGPSAHAIIRRAHPNDTVPEGTLLEAARLVAEKSWQRDDARADIMVALVRHVHAVKGAKAGTVRVDTLLTSLRVQTNISD